MKKVLLVTNNFPPPFWGGILNFYYNLCSHGHEELFRVIAPKCKGAGEFDGESGLDMVRVRVPMQRTIPRRAVQVALFAAQTFVQCARKEVAIIWCGHVYLSPIAYVMNRIFKVPFFIILHGSETEGYFSSPLKSAIFRHVVSRAAFLFSNSEYVKEQFRASSGYRGDMHILNPGVDAVRFKAQGSRKTREAGGEFRLLTVGSLVKKKNHESVLRAIASLGDEVPSLHYTIIGEGEERERLEKLAFGELGLEGKVDFLGIIEGEALIENFHKADVFIMPSRKVEERRGTESFGIVYLEANASGLPVIAGRSGGVSEAVVDGGTGLLVDPESVSEIAEAIRKLYLDPELVRRLGRNGEERAERDFRWEDIAERFVAIIRQYAEV